MATVNIRRDVDDKFYRYKMPVLLTKIEGRGNGIKTVVPNMDEIAKALSRPPAYPTKFFGCELGAQTTYANDRYIVNGQHGPDRLRELLDMFIDKFVLCASCKNPETELLITTGRNENIQRDCKACGARTDIDMRHKLTTFILKNPPANAKGKGGKKKKDKYAEAEELREAQLAGPGSNVPIINSNDASPAPGLADGAAPAIAANSLAATDDWAVDTSEAAMAARMSNLAVNIDGFAGGLGDEDEDEDVNSPYGQFGAWLEDNKGSATDAEIAAKAKELEIYGKHKTCVALGERLWTEEDVVAEVGKRVKILKVMSTPSKSDKADKFQKALLGGLEKFWARPENMDSITVSVPKVLMALYQEDILDEEVIKHWGTHASGKYVDKDSSKKIRKSADPILKWLEEAEDDEEDDSEEDDEE